MAICIVGACVDRVEAAPGSSCALHTPHLSTSRRAGGAAQQQWVARVETARATRPQALQKLQKRLLHVEAPAMAGKRPHPANSADLAVWPPAFWPLRLPACDPARLHTRTRPRSFGTARPVAGFSFGAPPAAAAVSAFGAAAAGLGASMPAAAPATEAGGANAAAGEAPELSAQLDGELAQCLRHMSKRDTTTKLKALQVCVKRQCAAHAAGHAHCCCTPAPFQPRSWGLPACVKHAAAAFV